MSSSVSAYRRAGPSAAFVAGEVRRRVTQERERRLASRAAATLDRLVAGLDRPLSRDEYRRARCAPFGLGYADVAAERTGVPARGPHNCLADRDSPACQRFRRLYDQAREQRGDVCGGFLESIPIVGDAARELGIVGQERASAEVRERGVQAFASYTGVT